MADTGSQDDLSALHKLMTDSFTKLLRGEVKRVDDEGKEHVVYPTASELAVIRAFLKDNNITAPIRKGGKLDELHKKLQEGQAVRARPATLPIADDLADHLRFPGEPLQ
jgi:hypothetical protein